MSHDRERRRMLLAGVGAVGALAMARSARAATCGDPGPLAPTGPTMRQVYDKIALDDEGLAEARMPITGLPSSPTSMYRITAPGVYYLTGPITATPGLSIIEVDSDDVEIECDGHPFISVPGALSCIRTVAPHKTIGVYDAMFIGFRETCIDFHDSTDCYVEETWWRDCILNPASQGICVLGDGGTIDDCNVVQCSCAHLRVGANGTFEENVIRECTQTGMYSVGPAVCEDNFLLDITGPGGIAITTGAVVMGNRLVSCSGIHVGANSVVQENDLSGCSNGIVVDGSGSMVEENHVSSGGSGIAVVSPATSVVVEANNVVDCTGTAIYVAPSSLSLVFRNAVSASPPTGVAYDIGAGNTWGSIVSAVGTGDLGGSGVALDYFINLEF